MSARSTRTSPALAFALVGVMVVAIAGCGSDTPHASTTATARPAPPARTLEVAPTEATTVMSSAVATVVAVRVDPPFSECQRIAMKVASLHPATTTQVVVRTAGWADTIATVEVATRVGPTWVCTPPMSARVGRTGLRPLLERRSGDGTTPAGVFALATMTGPDGRPFSFFGNAADPGVSGGSYRRVVAGDCFGATPGTPGYGHLRNDPACSGADDEYLPQYTTTYSNAALIGANMEPEVSGDEPGETPYAAAIFLHRHTYVSGQSGATKPTSGCVSLAQPDLSTVLVGMTADTRFVIGPTDWLLQLA